MMWLKRAGPFASHRSQHTHYPLGHSMGMDSVELVFAFEDTFDITIADGDAEKMLTIEDVSKFIAAELTRLGRPQNQDDTIIRVTVIASEHLGGPLNKIEPGSRFVEDLGMG